MTCNHTLQGSRFNHYCFLSTILFMSLMSDTILVFMLLYNVPIKSKRPALVRCSNGKRGGFCCYKDTNNH